MLLEAEELGHDYDQTQDVDLALVNYKPELGVRSLEERFATTTLDFGGKRFKVDAERKYVEYMGWSFYLSFTRALGIMFYGIKFKGECILYELSHQEATAQHGGFQPKAASTVYHDTYYSLGIDMGVLVEGFDYPFGATFLNVRYHDGNQTGVNPDTICIFKADSRFPLSPSHRWWGQQIRFSEPLDGQELPADRPWCCRPRPNCKSYFDIVSSSNNLEVSEFVIVNQTQPWFPEIGSLA
jgi:primary-amine oxidase